ncbi:hypothetical protein F9U64_16275 [Gracilibacillus oryzae]|uniref:Uncharacterized protein n=1 Tax=Gracilibacillus oryzae TaxID=1672701 RepID=A0A7C8KSK5_9BACI|nr:hypothetical protein F9U64_16275 [Gracilibacillus oryzae]
MRSLKKEVHPILIEKFVLEIAVAEKEIDEARQLMDDDCEYIGYREGLVDAYNNVLRSLNVGEDEVEHIMETINYGK